ncbi:MAG: hypothetical protein NTW62_00240 [Candidatus Nomurabacteria bacterium]|nr:hypothetical protein [Candidatus Nomurabacteria bacterium]
MKLKLSNTKKFIAFGVLALYLLLPLYIFQHMMSMGHDHMAPMAPTDCPYMDGQSAVCPIDFFGHLNTLQKNLILVFHSFKIIFLLIIVFIVSNLLYTSPPLVRFLLYIKRQKIKFIDNLYQSLFSRGILNPKTH